MTKFYAVRPSALNVKFFMASIASDTPIELWWTSDGKRWRILRDQSLRLTWSVDPSTFRLTVNWMQSVKVFTPVSDSDRPDNLSHLPVFCTEGAPLYAPVGSWPLPRGAITNDGAAYLVLERGCTAQKQKQKQKDRTDWRIYIARGPLSQASWFPATVTFDARRMVYSLQIQPRHFGAALFLRYPQNEVAETCLESPMLSAGSGWVESAPVPSPLAVASYYGYANDQMLSGGDAASDAVWEMVSVVFDPEEDVLGLRVPASRMPGLVQRWFKNGDRYVPQVVDG